MKIGIIGKGNVGTHLNNALSEDASNNVCLINSRTFEGLEIDCDLLLICVKDDAIEGVAAEIARYIPDYQGTVAHTSGSVSMEILRSRFSNCGVLYPLQTFTKQRELNYAEIPVFIEAQTEESENLLRMAASSFTDKIYQADSEKRKALHVGAVLSCNFVNFLYGKAEEILKENGYDFSVLYPLIKETLERTRDKSPTETQTGPAARGDFNVINSHLEFLGDKPETERIYRLLTNSIYIGSKEKIER